MAARGFWRVFLLSSLVCVSVVLACDQKDCQLGTAIGTQVGATIAAIGGISCAFTFGIGCLVVAVGTISAATSTALGKTICDECENGGEGGGGNPQVSQAIDSMNMLLKQQKAQLETLTKEQLKTRFMQENWFNKLSSSQRDLLTGQAAIKLNQANVLHDLTNLISQTNELENGINRAHIISLYGEDITNLINIKHNFNEMDKDDLGQITNNIYSDDFLEYADDFKYGLKTSMRNVIRMLTSGHPLKTESLWELDPTFCSLNTQKYFLQLLYYSFHLRRISLAMEGDKMSKQEIDQFADNLVNIDEQFSIFCGQLFNGTNGKKLPMVINTTTPVQVSGSLPFQVSYLAEGGGGGSSRCGGAGSGFISVGTISVNQREFTIKIGTGGENKNARNGPSGEETTFLGVVANGGSVGRCNSGGNGFSGGGAWGSDRGGNGGSKGQNGQYGWLDTRHGGWSGGIGQKLDYGTVRINNQLLIGGAGGKRNALWGGGGGGVTFDKKASWEDINGEGYGGGGGWSIDTRRNSADGVVILYN